MNIVNALVVSTSLQALEQMMQSSINDRKQAIVFAINVHTLLLNVHTLLLMYIHCCLQLMYIHCC